MLAMILLLCLGCGESARIEVPSISGSVQKAPQSTAAETATEPRSESRSPALPHKIIRTADLQFVVKDFEQAGEDLKRLIGEFKEGYLAHADVTGSAGAPRHGKWVIRIPVAQFEAFIEAANRLGVPQSSRIDSQDVTEEYYDLDTRIKNHKVEENRLLKHLERSTAKLEEILAVEREINRVRGEIEQQEGRLRRLAELTTFTTVTVTIQEVKNYAPPQPLTFSGRIVATFFESVDALKVFAQETTLLLVALAPWLPIIAVIAAVIWLVIRRRKSLRFVSSVEPTE
jgi:hypothetical protein